MTVAAPLFLVFGREPDSKAFHPSSEGQFCSGGGGLTGLLGGAAADVGTFFFSTFFFPSVEDSVRLLLGLLPLPVLPPELDGRLDLAVGLRASTGVLAAVGGGGAGLLFS